MASVVMVERAFRQACTVCQRYLDAHSSAIVQAAAAPPPNRTTVDRAKVNSYVTPLRAQYRRRSISLVRDTHSSILATTRDATDMVNRGKLGLILGTSFTDRGKTLRCRLRRLVDVEDGMHACSAQWSAAHDLRTLEMDHVPVDGGACALFEQHKHARSDPNIVRCIEPLCQAPPQGRAELSSTRSSIHSSIRSSTRSDAWHRGNTREKCQKTRNEQIGRTGRARREMAGEARPRSPEGARGRDRGRYGGRHGGRTSARHLVGVDTTFPGSGQHKTAKDASLVGLCNRCSARTLHGLLPHFWSAAQNAPDIACVIQTIMDSLVVSDEYVDVFVAVLDHLRGVPGVACAIDAYAKAFLFSDTVFFSVPTPDPLEDYDEFCRAVKAERLRANTTTALVRLGFGAMAATRIHDAIRVLSDPCKDANKSFAVHFVACALPHADDKRDILHRAREMSRTPTAFGLHPRTRFAMMDLTLAYGCAEPSPKSAEIIPWAR